MNPQGDGDWDSGLGTPKKRYRDDKRKIIIKLEKETNIKTMITCGRAVDIKCCLLWFLLFV